MQRAKRKFAYECQSIPSSALTWPRWKCLPEPSPSARSVSHATPPISDSDFDTTVFACGCPSPITIPTQQSPKYGKSALPCWPQLEVAGGTPYTWATCLFDTHLSRRGLYKKSATSRMGQMDYANMILRASPSGSSAIRHLLSQIIVLLFSELVGSHLRPGMLGFPVAANAAHDAAIFFPNACASGVFLAHNVWCYQSRIGVRQCAMRQGCHRESASAK